MAVVFHKNDGKEVLELLAFGVDGFFFYFGQLKRQRKGINGKLS